MNVKKYTKRQASNILEHCNRSNPNRTYSNQQIQHNKTYLNYNLAPIHEEKTDYEFMVNRCKNLKVMNRDNIIYMASWVVTLPKDYTGNIKEFFKNTYNFLENKYGSQNVISSYVHMDETTPHMHFCFVPVITENEKERVNAKKCINRKELKKIHIEIQEYLKQQLKQDINMLNGKTENGNKTILEFKNENLQKSNKKIENDISIKQEIIEDMEQEIDNKNEELQNINETIKQKHTTAFTNLQNEIEAKLKQIKIKDNINIEPEITVKGFGKNKKEIIDKSDYDKLKTNYKNINEQLQLQLQSNELEKIQKEELEQELKEIRENKQTKKYNELENNFRKLRIDNEKLKLQNSNYKKEITKLNQEKEELFEDKNIIKNTTFELLAIIRNCTFKIPIIGKLIDKVITKAIPYSKSLNEIVSKASIKNNELLKELQNNNDFTSEENELLNKQNNEYLQNEDTNESLQEDYLEEC